MGDKEPKLYVSVDIEATGKVPGKYSMLSLGACIVGETHKQFYSELKPLNLNYNLDAMKTGCLGLNCLIDLYSNPHFNPKSNDFDPERVLLLMFDKADEPLKAMTEFKEWIVDTTKGYRPVIAAAPVVFDGMFIAWYFHTYLGENPLGYSGEDMNSVYRGLMRNVDAHMAQLKIPDTRARPHNALDDAIQQAKEFEQVLELMKRD